MSAAAVMAWAGWIAWLLLSPFAARAAEGQSSVSTAQEARVIVTYRDRASLIRAHPWRRGDAPAQAREAYRRRAAALSARLGLPLRSVRAVGERGHAMRALGVPAAALAARLRADPDVQSVVIDQRRRAFSVPNDPLFAAGPALDPARQRGGPESGQWFLRAPDALFRSATNVQGAWRHGRGDPSIVVAVLDTGVLRDHEDLDPGRTGRVLPGYDLVEDLDTANDGDGRDGNSTDPGDWLTFQEVNDESSPYFGCGEFDEINRRYLPQVSSWHGTMVAGLIGAQTANGLGMAGIASGTRLLPVRVLGKCGGWDSDILAGMYWAAGIDQAGIPPNPYPARVVNLSLGGLGDCTEGYLDAVNALLARNIVLIAAAGNTEGRAVGAPANCPGVVAVTGLRHAGTKVGFADLGPEVAIAAPGGNCVNIRAGEPCLYPILSASNAGLQRPAEGSLYTDSYRFTVGTSFAAPLVSGTVALMLSARPDLSPVQVRSFLQSTARPFPREGADNGEDLTAVPSCVAPTDDKQLQCYCVTGLCGAGMLDASAAVAAAASAAPADTGGGSMSAAWLLALALAAWVLARADRQGARRGSVG